jgi:hypothetical protein
MKSKARSTDRALLFFGEKERLCERLLLAMPDNNGFALGWGWKSNILLWDVHENEGLGNGLWSRLRLLSIA